MAGAPAGNQNGQKRNRLLSDALKRELVQNPDDAVAIVRRLIEDAKAGDNGARGLLFDRVDGKVPQPLVGDEESDPIKTLSEILIRSVSPTD